MKLKKITPLVLAFLISIQSIVSYPKGYYYSQSNYSELTNVGVRLIYLIVTMAIGGYIIAWIQKRNLRPDSFFSTVFVKKNLADFKGKVAKSQLVLDFVDQLNNPLKYQQMNVYCPKGILFYGDPGCGKTHLARCIAGEVNCPFIETNATKFSQPLFGNSRASIENLFKTAEQLAQKHPSKTVIIFIDEFDSIGSRKDKNRYFNFSNPEIITTLLGQMDGFEERNVNIVVIGATNCLNKIDRAIIRSGRFDAKVLFSYPDENSRKELIEYFFQKNRHDGTISNSSLAQVTDGMTPADIKELFNAAGREAINHQKQTRDRASFVSAMFQRKQSERDQQIASREERLELINRMMDINKALLPSDLTVEGLLNCTEFMTAGEVREIFTLADKYSAEKGYKKITLDMIAITSLIVEDQIKITKAKKEIDIAQKIYGVDKETINNKWNDKELLLLTSSDIIQACENMPKVQKS